MVGIGAVFQNAFVRRVPFPTTPSAPLKEASDFFLMSRPRYVRRGMARRFIHTFFDPPTDITWTRSYL